MSSHRRDEDALNAQSNVVRLVTARSGLAAAAGGLLVLWLVVRWIRNR